MPRNPDAGQWTYAYLPCGGVRTETKNQNQAPANVLRYTGELLDATGLNHLRARQYDSGTGRFLSVDPAGAATDEPYLSTYGYGQNNPVRFTDPSGLDTYGLCFGGQAAFALGASAQICLIATTDLEVGLTLTPAGLAGSPNLSVNGSVQHSNAASINDLGQGFDLGGASAGEGVALGFESFSGSGHCGQPVTGQTASVQATLKGPVIEGHIGKSYTFIPLNLDFGGIVGDTDPSCPTEKGK